MTRLTGRLSLVLAIIVCCGAVTGSAYAEEPKLPIAGTFTYPAGESPGPHEMGPGTSSTSNAQTVEPFSSSQCPQYYICLWENATYAGVIWSATGRNNEWRYVGSGMNDRASAIWNRRTNSTWVARDYPAAGDYACIGSGWSYESLTKGGRGQEGEYLWPQSGKGANDSISSYWLAESTYNNCSEQPQLL